MAKKMKSDPPELLPMLMPASMMAKVSGIGEATLRTLMAQGEIEYLQIGNHRIPFPVSVQRGQPEHAFP